MGSYYITLKHWLKGKQYVRIADHARRNNCYRSVDPTCLTLTKMLDLLSTRTGAIVPDWIDKILWYEKHTLKQYLETYPLQTKYYLSYIENILQEQYEKM